MKVHSILITVWQLILNQNFRWNSINVNDRGAIPPYKVNRSIENLQSFQPIETFDSKLYCFDSKVAKTAKTAKIAKSIKSQTSIGSLLCGSH